MSIGMEEMELVVLSLVILGALGIAASAAFIMTPHQKWKVRLGLALVGIAVALFALALAQL